MGSAIGLSVAQAVSLFANSAILTGTSGISLREAAGASFFVWGCICAISAATLAIQAAKRECNELISVVSCSFILASTVGTSHAVARVEHRPIVLLVTAAHQAATACWIGGLPYLLTTLSAMKSIRAAYALCRRFTLLAIISASVLPAAGSVLAVFYVGSVPALYGTNYGVMLIGKAVLWGMILILGAFNHLIVRQLHRGETTLLLRLRRLGEAELGIGITAILTAASLTSQPPATDLTLNRVSWPTIVARMSPLWPAMKTPPLSTLSPSSRELWKEQRASGATSVQAFVPGESYSPPTKGDIEWSEYNHHWAGLVVFVMGLLAVLARFARMRWARHWPLAFVGLAIFLFFRADPENWPLGPSGFWESFSSADVTQHRIFVVLIVLFAVFEWGVQTGRLTSSKPALVFPLICATGGAMLVTHTHSLTNLEEQLLVELIGSLGGDRWLGSLAGTASAQRWDSVGS